MAWLFYSFMDQSNRHSLESFYIILPSNGCALTQPNNSASSYIIDWQSAINLQGNWEVGLTEYSFNYFPTIIRSDEISLKYTINRSIRDEFELTIIDNFLRVKGMHGTKLTENITFSINAKKQIVITCIAFPFNVEFIDENDALNYGFDNTSYTSNTLNLIGDRAFTENFNENVTVFISHAGKRDYVESIMFPEYILFSKVSALVEHLNKICSKVFTKFEEEDGKLSFSLEENVTLVKFSKSLSELLGLGRDTFPNNKSRYPYLGKKAPRLAKAYNQIYIYSSVTEPILVGGVNVPLIRNIYVENKYDIGDLVHDTVDNIMYLPVSSTSINNIEVELRNDSGELINFPYGSKTCLTLHFKKK